MKDAFWGQIFGLLSAGGATIETIRQYIESQGEKNSHSVFLLYYHLVMVIKYRR